MVPVAVPMVTVPETLAAVALLFHSEPVAVVERMVAGVADAMVLPAPLMVMPPATLLWPFRSRLAPAEKL